MEPRLLFGAEQGKQGAFRGRQLGPQKEKCPPAAGPAVLSGAIRRSPEAKTDGRRKKRASQEEVLVRAPHSTSLLGAGGGTSVGFGGLQWPLISNSCWLVAGIGCMGAESSGMATYSGGRT